MAEGHKDYSGVPLWKKLGIVEGGRVLVIGAPPTFHQELVRIAPLPHAVEFLSRAAKALDVAIVFATRQPALGRGFTKVKPNLLPGGRLWIAWPKKSSKVPTDITFQSAQGLGLAAGMVDNKTAAIDAVYQGLQFVYRVKDRGR